MKSFILSVSVAILLLTGCGGGGGSSSSGETTVSVTTTSTGLFLDTYVSGLKYSSKSHSGITDSNGYFNYTSGEDITFKIGNITLGTAKVDSTGIVTPFTTASSSDINNPKVINTLRILQSLDDDHNPSNGINISQTLPNHSSINLSESSTLLTDSQLTSYTGVSAGNLVTATDAQNHFSSSLSNMNQYKTALALKNATNSGATTGGTTSPTTSGTYTLLAWNDLGMHCFDGSDFSVFSILPPYNNLNAHLIKKDENSNKHITTGVTLTYESYTYNGHVYTQSSTKTNFWNYLVSLFPGATSVADVGLTGNKAPSSAPQAMAYNSTHNWFEADGIPIVNRDDNNATNYYPMVRVIAKNTAGTTLASADVVLPVSDEMDCAKCHASTVTSPDARPIAGWENEANVLKDYKFNILKLHDEEHPINASDLTAVNAKGYNYQASLYDTAKSGTPILCASCHSSNALATTSIGNAKPLTTSLHSKHAGVIDPSNGLTLNNSTNRDSCYSCHPGAATECLRGAMGSATDASGNQTMQCQSCHGTMSDVGNTNRIGWMDEPNCQVCHQNGQRYDSALVNGSMRAALDSRFATNPNTPAAGVSLYRFSTGHGDLQCSSCHGSTHAIFPSTHAEDNIQSINVQGHSGTIAECTSCHTTMPSTTTGGPHGMHTVGQGWVSSHQHVADGNAAQCKTCHGNDYRGSVLSKTFSARTLSVEHGTKTFAKGHMVSCYDCHNGPNP